MLVSMTPNEEVKTIHASLNDGSLRKWEFEPYTENGKIELTDQDYATIQSIKGNTVKFNQLMQNGNFADTSGWIYNENPTFTVSDNIAIIKGNTDYSGIYRRINLLQNHKYYLSETLKAEVDNYNFLSGIDYLTSNNAKILTTNFQTFKRIGTYTGSDTVSIYFYDYNNATRNNVYIKNVMLFDLTLIFGSGNEPATPEAFETWLSNNIGLLPYYDYTPGSLISFNATGLKTENASQTESNTLSLPISTYFPTGMKEAGSVYDELTESKAITRIGSRAYQSGDESDTSVITDGTTTYYALTTPTEVDISLDLSYDVWDNGTEQILPVNGSTPTTSSMKATIEYPDRTEEVNFLYKQTTFESANPQFSLVCKNQELPMALEDGKLICECDSSITNESGFFDCKVKMQDLNSVAYSQKIQLHVERGIND